MTKNLAAFAIFAFALAYSGVTAPFRGARAGIFCPFLPFAMISMANGTFKNIRWCWPVALTGCLLSNLVALALLARETFFS